MNKLLQAQIQKFHGEHFDINSLPENMHKFYDAISQSYDTFESEKIKNKKRIDEYESTIHLLKQYKQAINSSLIVTITDLKGTIKYVNDNFCKISGYTREELLNKSHNIVRDPQNDSKIFREMWKTLLQKKVWQGVFPNLHKDGSRYYLSTTIVPLLNIDGNIVEFIALRENITQIIKYQKEINTEKQRFSKILDNQESIIVVLNEDEGVIEVNQKFYETFHFKTLEEFKEKYFCICELFKEKEGFLKKSTSEEIWFDPILTNPKKVHKAFINNKIYNVKLATLNLQNKETYLATLTDITDIEEARIKSEEAELSKSNFLANMSHEIRTPMNAILGFSQLLIGTSLDAKQLKYVSLIKNSSITLIEIINDILDFSKLESGQIDLELIKVNPFMAFEETFLLLSQDAKAKEISYMIKIDHRIEECIKIDSFHVKQILINLIGNAIKFTPSQGTIDVRIKKIFNTKGDKIMRFSVQDTGIGIPQERQKKIFEPFSQADSSTTREFGGTGLGLSISSSLVNMMGSKLELKSEVGKGSKFYFDVHYESCDSENTLKQHLCTYDLYLYGLSKQMQMCISLQLKSYDIKHKKITHFDPVIDTQQSIIITTDENIKNDFKNANIILLSKTSEDLADGRQTNIDMFEEFPSIIYNELMRMKIIKSEIKSIKNEHKLNLKILVAEDYDINRILITELLGQFAIEHDFAYNGKEAVEMVQKTSYDLILMDINMPIMNGIDATKVIINELKMDIPIVALTANALEGDKEKFMSVGMVDYLSKPIDIEAFENLLIKYNNTMSSQSIKTENVIDQLEIDQQQKVVNSQKIIFDVQSSLEIASKRMQLPSAIMDKIFNSFFNSIEDIRKKMRVAIASSDYTTIEMTAHNLKSSSATFVFDEMSKYAQELEKNAKQKNKDFEFEKTFQTIELYLNMVIEYKNNL